MLYFTQLEINKCCLKLMTHEINVGTSLGVQWLTLQAPKAGDPSSIPGERTKSRMPQEFASHN